VSTSYREGAEALGLPVSWTLRKIVLKPAIPGIVTGMLVAPSKTAQDQSYDAAFLLIVFVLLLIIAGRLITWFAGRHSEYL
jgi:phosphate transport system permease protein